MHLKGRELGLKCLCTSDERTREIGVGLLDALSSAKLHDFPAFNFGVLCPAAERALVWLQNMCCEPNEGVVGGPQTLAEEAALPPTEREAAQLQLAKNLEEADLKEAERLTSLMTTLHTVLATVESEAGSRALFG